MGLGAGVRKTIGKVELGRMASPFSKPLECLNSAPTDIIGNRHDVDPGLLQKRIEIHFNVRRWASLTCCQNHGCLKSNNWRGKFLDCSLDRAGKSLRLVLLAEDSHNDRCINEHQRVHISSRSASVTGRASGPA